MRRFYHYAFVSLLSLQALGAHALEVICRNKFPEPDEQYPQSYREWGVARLRSDRFAANSLENQTYLFNSNCEVESLITYPTLVSPWSRPFQSSKGDLWIGSDEGYLGVYTEAGIKKTNLDLYKVSYPLELPSGQIYVQSGSGESVLISASGEIIKNTPFERHPSRSHLLGPNSTWERKGPILLRDQKTIFTVTDEHVPMGWLGIFWPSYYQVTARWLNLDGTERHSIALDEFNDGAKTPPVQLPNGNIVFATWGHVVILSEHGERVIQEIPVDSLSEESIQPLSGGGFSVGTVRSLIFFDPNGKIIKTVKGPSSLSAHSFSNPCPLARGGYIVQAGHQGYFTLSPDLKITNATPENEIFGLTHMGCPLEHSDGSFLVPRAAERESNSPAEIVRLSPDLKVIDRFALTQTYSRNTDIAYGTLLADDSALFVSEDGQIIRLRHD